MTPIKNATRRYVAISYTELDAWTMRPCYSIEYVGDAGESKDSVEEKAQRAICGDQWNNAKDIHTDTALKNLFVVTESAAKRSYSAAYNHYLMPEYC